MINRSIFRLLMMSSLFLLIVTFAAIERPAHAQCDPKSDIVDNIYTQLKADKGLASQGSHINVVFVSELSTVKLMGWADNKSDWEKARDIVLSNCVKANVNDFANSPPPAGDALRFSGGSCQAGFKVCGDLCIPSGETCSIKPTRQ